MPNDYLMEHDQEAERIHRKTDYGLIYSYIEKFNIPKDAKILDVGCGSGDVLNAHFKKDYKNCFGLDYSLERLIYAKNLMKDYKPLLISGDAYNLPFSDEFFDVVHSRFLFEYLKDPIRCLLEMKRVTKKGGKVIVGDLDGNCVFNAIMDKNLETVFLKIIEKLSSIGFDPYVGRKLFSYFHQVELKDISVYAEIYHKIFGKISKKDKENWDAKIKNVVRLISSQENREKILEIVESYNAFLNSEKTLTYSVLFYVVGTK